MFKQLFSGIFSSTDSLPITELAKALKEESVVLLDVREVEEFSNGHVPQAINHPLSELDQFTGDKSKQYLVICQSGMRSKRACSYLKEQGLQATNVQGGMNAWNGPIKGGK